MELQLFSQEVIERNLSLLEPVEVSTKDVTALAASGMMGGSPTGMMGGSPTGMMGGSPTGMMGG